MRQECRENRYLEFTVMSALRSYPPHRKQLPEIEVSSLIWHLPHADVRRQVTVNLNELST